jgi:hypothetical protein
MTTRTALALAAGSTVLLSTGCAAHDASTRAPTARAPTSAPATRVVVTPARRADSVPAPEPPRGVTLPSGRTVPVRAVGTTYDGLLAVPADVDLAGWWRGGARVGDPFGSTLVAAHVDSRVEGLGPFAELLTLPRGAPVVLVSAGLRQEFEVTSRRLVPQGSLGGDTWIFDASGERRLTLVTCAPPYDAARGGYQNLAVVTARPLGPPEET